MSTVASPASNTPNNEHPDVESDEDGDSSDVSMSADSDDSDQESGTILQTNSIPDHPQTSTSIAAQSQGTKRKLSSSNEIGPVITNDERFEHHKKAKTDDGLKTFWTTGRHIATDRSLLPVEIWHQILTFVPPKSLGRLLRVNKTFNAYLDASSIYQAPVLTALKRSATPKRQPDAIWQASRRLYRPTMPTPLDGLSELQMWRLACSSSCQFCHKESSITNTAPPVDQWHAGPGQSGVRSIWLFRIRSCGDCLQKQSIKVYCASCVAINTDSSQEIDLLLSSSVPGPLMVAVPFVFMTDDAHVVSAATLSSTSQPANTQVTKRYSKAGVEDIKQEFFRVKSLGPGTAEEWLKGLEDRVKEARTDANRWERWEASGGVQRMKTSETAELTEVIRRSLPRNPLTNAAPIVVQPQAQLPRALPTMPPHSAPRPISGFDPQAAYNIQQLPPTSMSYGPSMNTTPFAPYPVRTLPPGRQVRTREEVMELKAARKAEIERRSMLLQPPITPGVLGHMSSFQAAIQIITPFDDRAWDLLLPRLLQQREEAEKREAERLAHARAVQAQFEMRRQQEVQHKPEAIIESDWEVAQAPLRHRIGVYADAIIANTWGGGSYVNSHNSPKFAADVLVQVRRRFYEEMAKEDAILRELGQEPKMDTEEGPYTRSLTLENMKWIFDNKIKPHTDQNRRELFLCNGCDSTKWYGFEGVIQHYAAKHTEALSSGSIVVHWRAEWPKETPFNPDPLGERLIGGTGYDSSSSTPGFSAYTSATPANTTVPTESGTYGQTTSGDHLFPQGNDDKHGTSSHNTIPNLHAGISGQYDHSTGSVVLGQTSHLLSQSQASLPLVGTVRTEEYRTRLSSLANTASSIWKATAGVKEMIGPIRIFVVLFHILKEFREKYDDDPPLSMIIDGLSNNKDMRPVRNINGLACKACRLEEAYQVNNHSRPARGGKPQEKKLLSCPQLLNHFQLVHIAGVEGPPQYDWATEMVDLPERKKIAALARAPGMDEYKLQLVKEALPLSFIESPPPVDQIEPDFDYDKYMEQDKAADQDQLPPSKDNHSNYYAVGKSDAPAAEADDSYNRRSSNGAGKANRKRNSRKEHNYDDFGRSQSRSQYQGEQYDPRRRSYDAGTERPQNHNYSNEDYLEGPKYYSSAANLSELLASPALKTAPSAEVSIAQPLPVNAPVLVTPRPEQPSAAERFLNEFEPGESVESYNQKVQRQQPRPVQTIGTEPWSVQQNTAPDIAVPRPLGSIARERQPVYEEEYIPLESSSAYRRQAPAYDGRGPYEMAPQPRREVVYEYEDQYGRPINDPRQEPAERQDQRQEIIYVDEKNRRVSPPPGYPRYEVVPPITRPRSPLYAEPAPPRYREASLEARYTQHDAYTRTRIPHGTLESVAYERPAPRQEYYPVYEDRRPQPRYEDVEYVPAEERHLDYGSHRPVHRAPETLYYGDEQPHRQTIYERQAAPIAHGQADEDDEYDPSNPILPSQPVPRQVRYL